MLRVHLATAMLASTRTVSTEDSLRATEVVLDILRRGGFSPVAATQAARHMLATITHLVAGEPGVGARGESEAMATTRARPRAVPERYPRLVEAPPLSEGVAPDDYFAFGLDLLPAGTDAMAARAC